MTLVAFLMGAWRFPHVSGLGEGLTIPAVWEFFFWKGGGKYRMSWFGMEDHDEGMKMVEVDMFYY